MSAKVARWLTTEELAARADVLETKLGHCDICPRACGVDRTRRSNGFCRSGWHPILSAHGPHFGEEPPISGQKGAGNLFFGNCNLRCVYCQNHQISQSPGAERHRAIDCRALSRTMMELAKRGCHNINLVSPTHFVPQIVRSLSMARAAGLSLPIVYNCNGYESVETLQLLDGIVHVYLPDLKYADEELARRYSGVDQYVDTARAAIREMYRQVGSKLVFDDRGMMIKGMIVRLLVLPNGLADVERSLTFIQEELSPDVAISLMAQYYPTQRVRANGRDLLLSRTISFAEWQRALAVLDRLGMENGWLQDWAEAPECYRPDFNDRCNPFKTAV